MNQISAPAGHYSYLAASCLSFLARNRCLAFPSRIHLQTQTRCNAHCAMCPYPEVSKGRQHGTMTWSLYDDITRQIASERSAPTIIYELHNEPLLNPDIFDWVHHMKVNAPSATCVLITNGSLLHHFAPSDIDASQVDLLAVSLNAHRKETFDQLNCGLDFDVVVENILRLAEEPALRGRLRVDFVRTEVNGGEIDEARAAWRERGVRTFSKPLANRAGTLTNYRSLAPSRGGHITPGMALRGLARHCIGCQLPFNEMALLHNGDAILCCHDWNHACVVGTASRQSLREIWNSLTMQRVRRSLLSGRVDSIAPCNKCSVASH